MITNKQLGILEIIDTYIKEKGSSPTIKDLSNILDFNLLSIDSLVQLGCISLTPSIPKAISITKDGGKLMELLVTKKTCISI